MKKGVLVLLGVVAFYGGTECVIGTEKRESDAKNVAKHMTFFSQDHQNKRSSDTRPSSSQSQ